jgi:hypothetical protein
MYPRSVYFPATILLAILFALCDGIAFSQSSSCRDEAPAKNIELLWSMAARGELLADDGWRRASGYFSKPNTQVTEKRIDIVSGYYAINAYSNDGKAATVDMEYTDLGSLDISLRYTPAIKTKAFKTSARYNLSAGPAFITWYSPDGNIAKQEEIQGRTAWLINGHPPSPWATVNATIRYVLEQHNKTTDPAIKKNADETLAILLKLH